MTSREADDRPTVDDLLSKGHWKSTRASQSMRSPLPSPEPYEAKHYMYDTYVPSSSQTTSISSKLPAAVPRNVAFQQDSTASNCSQSKTTRDNNSYFNINHTNIDSSQKPRRRASWPPNPSVEDEIDALAKEYRSRAIRTSLCCESDPPARGTVEQIPVILEADITPAEAADIQAGLQKEKKPLHKESQEKRFVLLSDPQSSASERDEPRKPPRRPSAVQETRRPVFDEESRRPGSSRHNSVPQPSQPVQEMQPPRSNDRRRRTSPQPLERRRSRQDLPSLQTKLASEVPPYRRSKSAFAYTPKAEDDCKTGMPSVDFITSSGGIAGSKQKSGEYNDRRPPLPQATSRVTRPVLEQRRTDTTSPAYSPASSHTSTPNSDRRYNAAESLAYASAKLTRPQQLASDVPHRQAKADRVERDGRDKTCSTKTSSSQSSPQYLLSSDDDLEDSSDSDRRKKRSRRHKHRPTSLKVDDEKLRHHRSNSRTNRTSLHVELPLRKASPRSSPKSTPMASPSMMPYVDRREAVKDARIKGPRTESPISAYTDARAGTLKPVSATDERTRRSQQPAIPAPYGNGKPTAAMPIPVPTRIDLHSPGDARPAPPIHHYDDEVDPLSTVNEPRRLNSYKPPPSAWKPPTFKSETSDGFSVNPVGSYRRFSEDIEDGSIAPLPVCPRITPVRGYVDWLTLPNCVGFNICPSCFNSTVAKTAYSTHFVPTPYATANEAIVCDFGSQPWYRIAWLLSLKERHKHLKFIYAIAEIISAEKPCLGKHEAVQKWYSVLDPDAGAPVRNFDICSSCTKSIEALLPTLKGLFVRTDNSATNGYPRVCDMRFDSKRFIKYFDSLELLAEMEPHPRWGMDTRQFVTMARRYASLPECPRDNEVRGATWWVITQLPDFTVCEECFEDVVRAGVVRKKAIPLMFGKKVKDSATSCQLYSDRMRTAVGRAIDGNDYQLLAGKVRERKSRELEYRKDMEDFKMRIKAGQKGAKECMTAAENDWKIWE